MGSAVGSAAGPLSVPVSPELRARLVSEAKRRKLKLATTARLLLDERVQELEQRTELSEAEAWQRAQAWATWEKVRAGEVRETTAERLREHIREAITRPARRPKRR